MLIYKKGNILEANEDIICHQVNVDGVMGGGLALQIANSYPFVFEGYKNFCERYHNEYNKIKGLCEVLPTYNSKGQMVANCFTQKPNFDTDYEAIRECFAILLHKCKAFGKSIAAPYKYGCGIANGDWNIVEDIFKELSEKEEVDIVIYQYEV